MRRTTRIFVGLAAISALVLGGCSVDKSNSTNVGQSGSESGGQSGTTSGTADMPPLEDINRQDRSALAEGGELRFAISSLPDAYNILHLYGSNVDYTTTMGRFLGINPNWLFQEDGSFEGDPNFIESFDVKEGSATEKQVVTLNLNKDAKWGNGKPINAADYIATVNACSGKDEKFVCAATDGFRDIESVEQGDSEFQVVVTYPQAFPDWSAALSMALPAEGVSDAKTFNEGWKEPNNDWIAGPYRFKDFDKAQEVITLEQNPDWWGEKPLLDEISFRAADPSAQSNAFANGELDVLQGIIDGEQYNNALTNPNAEVRRAGGLQWRHFTFNTESGVLQDQAVRQAIVKGIDNASIAAADLAGIPDLDPNSLLLGNHFFMPGQVGYEDNLGDYAYDPEAASAELDELGWKLDGEYRAKDGKALEFDYAMMPDISTSKTEGELLQSQMAAIGVKVNIVNVSTDEFFTDTTPEGKFGVTAFAWQGTQYPLANVGQIYGCDSVAPNGSNFSRLCVPEIDELDKQIQTEADSDKRNELGNEVDKVIWDSVMTQPIYRRLELTAVPKNLANYGAFGMTTVPGEDIGYMK